jgi:ParB-like chromosome segregation protein Spo0J
MPQATHISDLIPDPRNTRKRTERNLATIEASLKEVGAARSIVIDEDNVILAGNGTVEAAGIAGIEKLRIIDADGDTIIAVRRSGLTPDQKIRLSLADNRSAELAEWDLEQLQDFREAGVDFDGLFSGKELDKMLKGLNDIPDITIPADEEPIRQQAVVVMCADADEQEQVFRDISALGMMPHKTLVESKITVK